LKISIKSWKYLKKLQNGSCCTFGISNSKRTLSIRDDLKFMKYYSQPGPGASQEKFNPFFVKQSFSPLICLCFRVWGTLGSGDRFDRVKLVLRTFPESEGRSVQNLMEIGGAVRAWGDCGEIECQENKTNEILTAYWRKRRIFIHLGRSINLIRWIHKIGGKKSGWSKDQVNGLSKISIYCLKGKECLLVPKGSSGQ